MNCNQYKIFLGVLSAFFILSCSNGDHMQVSTSYQNIIGPISKKNWDELSRKKIYFGHQSVGFNIIDGIKDIMSETKKFDLKIKETDDLNDFSEPIFAHSRVGQNTNPSSKLEAFEHKIQQGLGEKIDIAFFKFCYVDITENTDVQKLFESYKQTMNNLQKEFPEITFMHATVPLKTVQTNWKTRIKKFLVKDNLWKYADNIKRNEFNNMIRQEYGSTGKIFDIAGAESTYPDGSQERFERDTKKYASLVPTYTYDGGHLNEVGRKMVAAHLLRTLTCLGD
jgi:hypothetical protein